MLTLAWKEVREHQPIWLTMVIMTGVLGFGLARIVSPGSDPTEMATLIILGMAATYGVVCGSMMLAGEHENGTLVFLDIFSGRRDLLWFSKFLIGAALALGEALTVALVLYLTQQTPPEWAPTLVGRGNQAMVVQARLGVRIAPDFWFQLLPVVTLEAYAWGLMGSSMTRRVLSAAGIAAVAAAVIWLFTIFTPPPIFLFVRLGAALCVLFISHSVFVSQPRETALGPTPTPDEVPDLRKQFLDRWETFEGEERRRYWRWEEERPALAWAQDSTPKEEAIPLAILVKAGPEGPAVGTSSPDDAPAAGNGTPPVGARSPDHAPAARKRQRRGFPEAESPLQVLWWLTFQQGAGVLAVLAGLSVLVGLLIPSSGQVLWPVATLLLGVACGTAAFAPEQKDQSYQFLAAQHFPLPMIWRFKILFWFVAALLGACLIVLAGFLLVLVTIIARPDPQAIPVPSFDFFGNARELLGSFLFLSVWLVYGFCTGQVFVWLCRKSVLALLISGMVSVAAIGLWLPSLLCKGMSGWQIWIPPLVMLLATQQLVRAWAGGRIKERRPLAALIGFGLVALAWLGLNYAHRAWEIRNIGAPLDRVAFRAAIPTGKANLAGQKIQEAVAEMEQANGNDEVWLGRIAEVVRLPVGVIESPPSDGQAFLLRYLPGCQKITNRLAALAARKRGMGLHEPAFDHIVQMLALSRNLRNKAPVESYMSGVEAEASALSILNAWLTDRKPAPEFLRRALDELSRHATETPSPLDCLETECFRAGGLLDYPTNWKFALDEDRGRQHSLTSSIAMSLEAPWEAERKTRLWQMVWSGLLRGIDTPHWKLPTIGEEGKSGSKTTKKILRGWLPATEGPGASVTPTELAGLLDASWLADERLYAPIEPLRSAATRGRWRVDACRLAMALALYQTEQGKPAQKLVDLVPKYVPELPVDPYRGLSFHYKVATKPFTIPTEPRVGLVEPAPFRPPLGLVRPGQGILWSTGPDRVDHGGHKHGDGFADGDPAWNAGLDLITLVPHWP